MMPLVRRAGKTILRTGRSLSSFPRYLHNFRSFRRLAQEEPSSLQAHWLYANPRLQEQRALQKMESGHYFLQDIWAAERVLAAAPAVHYDVGSRLDGFVAHLLPLQDVEIVDIRFPEIKHRRLKFTQGSVTALPYGDETIQSLSSLHVVEHVGLGRYGDELDPNGWRQAIAELKRVLSRGGQLVLSVPVGRERVEFNAHRILSIDRVLDEIADLETTEFAGILDSGELVAEPALPLLQTAEYACALLVLRHL